ATINRQSHKKSFILVYIFLLTGGVLIMQKTRKTLAMALTFVLMLALLAACGSSEKKGEGGGSSNSTQPEKNSTAPSNKPKERLKISMMYPLSGDAPQK